MLFDVFLSYASRNHAAVVEPLLQLLDDRGMRSLCDPSASGLSPRMSATCRRGILACMGASPRWRRQLACRRVPLDLWYDSVMDRRDDGGTDSEMEGIPTDYNQLEVSEWGLDWGDVSQIRDKLKLTPTERLRTAQDFMNTVIRIRAQNGYRAKV